MLSRLHPAVLIIFFFACNTIAAPNDDKENKEPAFIQYKLSDYTKPNDKLKPPRKRKKIEEATISSGMILEEKSTSIDLQPIRQKIRAKTKRKPRVQPIGLQDFSLNAKWQTCFTPRERCVETLTSILDQAKLNIYLQAYILSSQKIADALVRAHQRGVNVRVLVDGAQIKVDYSKLAFLDENGVLVYTDILATLAHNKVIVIDKEIIVTGSYNLSEAAETKNVENFIIIHDPKVAKTYLDSFIDRYQDSLRYKKSSEIILETSPSRPQSIMQMRMTNPLLKEIEPMKLEFAN